MKVDKKRAFGALLMASIGLALLFTAYTVRAYTLSPETLVSEYHTVYTEKGLFVHRGYFSNESVYRNGTGLDYYPEKITSIIMGNYTYTRSAGSGNYIVVLHEDYYVTSGRVKISITNRTRVLGSGSFEKSFSVPVTLNLTALGENLEEIKEGTGLYRAQVETYITVDVTADGYSFTQRIDLVKDAAGTLHFSGTEKDYKKVVRTVDATPNSLAFLGSDVGVSTARTVFPAMALLFAIPPAGFAYSKRGKDPKKKDELKGLRKYIVEGTPSPASRRVELSSAEDVERVFDLVDRPIVHYRDGETDVYAITDGETVYEYRAN